MVHIPTQKKIRENYETHLEKILQSKHRFAVVGNNSITYHDDRGEIYKEYPLLHPDQKIFGTPPILVDIGKETNSFEYKKEQLAEDVENLDNLRTRLNREEQELEKRRETLKAEENN